METLSTLPVLCAGNPTVVDKFPAKKGSNTDNGSFFAISLHKQA